MEKYKSRDTEMDKPFYWDRLVQLTHWALVCGCLFNWFVSTPGGTPHQLTGYAVLALVVVRLVWSLCGARKPARLRDMVPTFSGMKRHLRVLKARDKSLEGHGHNSFGLLFIWAAWLLIPAIAVSGYLAALGNSELTPVLPAFVSRWEDFAIFNALDEVHILLVTVLEVLAFVHVVAVLFTAHWLKHRYLASMILGEKDK